MINIALVFNAVIGLLHIIMYFCAFGTCVLEFKLKYRRKPILRAKYICLYAIICFVISITPVINLFWLIALLMTHSQIMNSIYNDICLEDKVNYPSLK